jgi:multiple sugar transport system permease protein
LQNVPPSLKEAAELDGANRYQRFFNITLPVISPTTFFLFIVMLIESLQAYDQINVLTQGGPSGSTRTLLYMYYLAAFDQFNVGYASAIVIVLVVICIILSLCSLLVSRRMVHNS